MKRKILGLLGVIVTVFMGAMVLAPEPASALGGGNCGASNFLGFRPWYQDLCNASNEIEQPAQGDEDDLKLFIWTIVLNVLFDITLAVGYLALGFVIWGGFQYVMSDGDSAKAAKAKQTLSSAIIGTIIAMVASVAVNTGTLVLGIDPSQGWQQGAWDAARLQGVFNWAYVVAGLIAVIFIIKGGIEYLLSQGEPARTKKATQSIIYAVVGLVVVILAAVITSFVMGTVGGTL